MQKGEEREGKDDNRMERRRYIIQNEELFEASFRGD